MYFLSEAGSRGGRNPGRQTHLARSPRLPGQAGSVRPRGLSCAPCSPERSRKPVPGSARHSPLLRAHTHHLTCRLPRKSRMPLPPEVRPPVRIPPLRPGKPPLATERQGRGRDQGVKGRTVTSPEGAGLRSAQPGRAFPSTPGAS